MVRTRTNSDDSDTCPICLENPNFAVETNCGHMYCGDCILEVRRNEPSISPISCPFCRQDVTILLACFTMSEVDSNSPEQAEIRDRIMREVRHYNRVYHQHPRSLSGTVMNPVQRSQYILQQQTRRNRSRIENSLPPIEFRFLRFHHSAFRENDMDELTRIPTYVENNQQEQLLQINLPNLLRISNGAANVVTRSQSTQTSSLNSQHQQPSQLNSPSRMVNGSTNELLRRVIGRTLRVRNNGAANEVTGSFTRSINSQQQQLSQLNGPSRTANDASNEEGLRFVPINPLRAENNGAENEVTGSQTYSLNSRQQQQPSWLNSPSRTANDVSNEEQYRFVIINPFRAGNNGAANEATGSQTNSLNSLQQQPSQLNNPSRIVDDVCNKVQCRFCIPSPLRVGNGAANEVTGSQTSSVNSQQQQPSQLNNSSRTANDAENEVTSFQTNLLNSLQLSQLNNLSRTVDDEFNELQYRIFMLRSLRAGNGAANEETVSQTNSLNSLQQQPFQLNNPSSVDDAFNEVRYRFFMPSPLRVGNGAANVVTRSQSTQTSSLNSQYQQPSQLNSPSRMVNGSANELRRVIGRTLRVRNNGAANEVTGSFTRSINSQQQQLSQLNGPSRTANDASNEEGLRFVPINPLRAENNGAENEVTGSQTYSLNSRQQQQPSWLNSPSRTANDVSNEEQYRFVIINPFRAGNNGAANEATGSQTNSLNSLQQQPFQLNNPSSVDDAFNEVRYRFFMPSPLRVGNGAANEVTGSQTFSLNSQQQPSQLNNPSRTVNNASYEVTRSQPRPISREQEQPADFNMIISYLITDTVHAVIEALLVCATLVYLRDKLLKIFRFKRRD